MNKEDEIQYVVRECTTERVRKENMPIHQFPKRRDAGQRWIEACTDSYLSRLEYRQREERIFFFVIDISKKNISIRREIVLFFQSAVLFLP